MKTYNKNQACGNKKSGFCQSLLMPTGMPPYFYRKKNFADRTKKVGKVSFIDKSKNGHFHLMFFPNASPWKFYYCPAINKSVNYAKTGPPIKVIITNSHDCRDSKQSMN